jgi:hypothetical protein
MTLPDKCPISAVDPNRNSGDRALRYLLRYLITLLRSRHLGAAPASRNRCRGRAETRCERCRRQGFSRQRAALDRSYLGPAKKAEAKLGQGKATFGQARVDLDKTIIKATDRRRDPQNQCAARRICADGCRVRSADDDGIGRSAACAGWTLTRPNPSGSVPATPRAPACRNPEISARLAFVRFEPYVLSKRSLTGETGGWIHGCCRRSTNSRQVSFWRSPASRSMSSLDACLASRAM